MRVSQTAVPAAAGGGSTSGGTHIATVGDVTRGRGVRSGRTDWGVKRWSREGQLSELPTDQTNMVTLVLPYRTKKYIGDQTPAGGMVGREPYELWRDYRGWEVNCTV